MLHLLTGVGILVCAVQAIRSRRLLVSALWLAGTSALVALELYLLGAPEIGVIELSVGAGLVTVLFVFAINLTGEEASDLKSLIRKPLAVVFIALSLVLLGILLVPGVDRAAPSAGESALKAVLWGDRQLDVVLQAGLVFCGVLGVLGLLREREPEAAGEKKSEEQQ